MKATDMFYHISFTVCGIEGQLKIEDKKRFADLSSIILKKEIKEAKVHIVIYKTQNKKFSAHIDNETSVHCFIPDWIPTYGVATLIKGLLQMLLLTRNVYLLHGYAFTNVIHIFGSNTELFDNVNGTIPIEKRTVYMRKEKGEYMLYNDFIPSGKWKKKRLNKIVCHPTIPVKTAEFIYESFFLYLCIVHFFTDTTPIKMPKYTKTHLLAVAEDLIPLVSSHRS